MEAKNNAKEFPKMFYCKHIQSSVVKYDDGMLYVPDEALRNMCKSFIGKPVYVLHQEVDLDNLQEKSDGYVTECFYNEVDGWFWAKFIAVSDEAQEAIRKGWSVSNAYVPTEYGQGGVCNNVDYDSSVINGEYTHLAIVPNPRYEQACIMTPDEFKTYNEDKQAKNLELKNSKKGTFMKFFKKEEVKELVELENSIVQLEDGSEVSLKDAIAAVENAKKNEAEEKAKEEEKENEVDMDMKVNVCGEDMSVSELMNKYSAVMAKKNAEDEEEKKKEEEKANAEKEEDEKKKEEEKENSKYFDELQNAIAFGKVENAKPVLKMDALARGKERY